MCKKCSRSFSETSGTPLHAIKKYEKFIQYAKRMNEGYLSLKDMALVTGISLTTAFEWRHKILCAINSPSDKYEGITDLDSRVIPYSRKGIKSGFTNNEREKKSNTNIIAVADYRNHSELTVVSIGHLKLADIPGEMKKKLIDEAIVLAPWKNPFYDFFKSGRIGYRLFNPGSPFNRFDVRKADRLHNSMKIFICQSMRGVSTKYLQSYANWIDWISAGRKRKYDKWQELIKNQMAWGRYTNRESLFKSFIDGNSDIEYRKTLNRDWKTACYYLVS